MNLSQQGKILEPKTFTIREMTRADLAVLEGPRVTPTVQKIRDSHHRVARLLALDMTQVEVARRTGYSTTRIGYLLQDPAFLDLVAMYRERIDARITEVEEEYVELLVGNRMKAERQISDKLDDADDNNEFLPTRDLIAISRDAADRTGFGKHSTRTNENIDWASKLERTINRSRRAAGTKIIEGTVVYPSPPLATETTPQSQGEAQGSDPASAPAPLNISRR